MDSLKVLSDVIVSPKEAFEAIRERPTWFLALIISVIASGLCVSLTTPALQHAILSNPPAALGQQAEALTPAQQTQAATALASLAFFNFLIVAALVPITCLVGALIMLIVNAIGRGGGSFFRYFAAQCNIAAIPAIGTIVSAAIVLSRGSDSFGEVREFQMAAPSLALLVPGGPSGLVTAFTLITPFTIWSAALTAVAMVVVGRVPKVLAWLTAFILLVGPAVFASGFSVSVNR